MNIKPYSRITDPNLQLDFINTKKNNYNEAISLTT